jgi:hypothetical protein
MTRRARSATTLILVGTGATGTVLGHAIGYVVAVPGGAERAELLRHSGHGYLPGMAAVAALAAVTAVAVTAARGFRRGRGSLSPRPGWWWSALRLSAIQSAAFVAMEVSERAAAGAHLSASFGRILALGILIQVLVAAVGAAILSLVEGTAERIGKAGQIEPFGAPVPAFGLVSGGVILPARLLTRPGLVRGPPCLTGL